MGALTATLALGASLALAAGSAWAAVCPPGAGTGQCSSPRGLAIDRSEGFASSGRLYVADSGNDRVNVFDDEGAFVFSFGSPLLDEPRSVAVDNDPLSASFRDIYVVDFGHRRVLKFEPDGTFLLAIGDGEYDKTGPEITEGMLVASGPDVDAPIGSDGEVYVADVRRRQDNPGATLTTRLRRYEPGGGAPVFGKDLFSVFSVNAAFNNLGGLAVDSAGAPYIRNRQPGERLCKYDPAGEKEAAWGEGGCLPAGEGEGVRALAIDETDRLFAGGLDSSFRVIAEYDPLGAPLRRFGYGALNGFVEGLAVGPGGAGPAYVSVGNEVLAIAFPPPGPIAVDPTVVPFSANAAVGAEVNPEGKASTYRFEWVLTQTCEEDLQTLGEGHCFDGAESTEPKELAAGTRIEPVEDAIGCPDPLSEAGEAESKCLALEAEYSWRIVATNADGEGEGTVRGEDFETHPSPDILDAWSTGVGTDSATLYAEVNPQGVPATGFFEYVSEESFDKSGFLGAAEVPDVAGGEAPLSFGAGTEATIRTATPISLKDGVEYRFRVLATNPLREESDPEIGAERAFSTLPRSGPIGCAVEGAREGMLGARRGQGAFLPDCRAYELVSPLDKNNADIVYRREDAGRLPATLEQSSTSGSRMTFTALTPFAEPAGGPLISHYIAARRAGAGWETHSISSPRKRLLTKALVQFDTEFEAFSEDLCEGWLRTLADPPLAEGAPAGALNLYRRSDEECGAKSYVPITTSAPPHLSPTAYGLELQGTSADGGRAIFRANDTLAGTGAPAEPAGCSETSLECKQRLYSQSAAEGTRYICIRPGGAAAESCAAGTSVKGSIAQRSRESDVAGAISADGSRVFWSEPAPGEGAIFMRDSKGTAKASDDTSTAVSAAGEALSGTSKSRWRCAGADGSVAIYTTGGDLYEFRPDSGATVKIAGKALGVAGCSKDASRVYFGSEEALAGENEAGETAQAGKPNLYLHEAGEGGGYAFIGTLAAIDVANFGSLGPLAPEPPFRRSRVTPDGGTLAFMSAAALSGQDNTDSLHGGPDMQVFLYGAGTGELTCASCNPTGARPLSFNTNLNFESSPVWAAGNIAGWENPLYAARALSQDGRRLFFESVDKLVARDTNGRRDVYQWEAPGEGTCTEAPPSYSPRNEGCVELISSGQGESDAELRDASPSGEDVFFTTSESLLPQDYGLIDIYDARVGGGLPVPDPLPPVCEGEACQSPPPAPEDPTPASATYTGPGNLAGGPAKPRGCPKGKRRVKRGGKTRCAKRHAGRARRADSAHTPSRGAER